MSSSDDYERQMFVENKYNRLTPHQIILKTHSKCYDTISERLTIMFVNMCVRRRLTRLPSQGMAAPLIA